MNFSNVSSRREKRIDFPSIVLEYSFIIDRSLSSIELFSFRQLDLSAPTLAARSARGQICPISHSDGSETSIALTASVLKGGRSLLNRSYLLETYPRALCRDDHVSDQMHVTLSDSVVES